MNIKKSIKDFKLILHEEDIKHDPKVYLTKFFSYLLFMLNSQTFQVFCFIYYYFFKVLRLEPWN